MFQKIVDKRNYIILLIIIILVIWVVWSLFFYKKSPYIETFNYYGEKITFKVYDTVNHNKLTREINNIFQKYEGVNNLFGKINESEKTLLEYGKILYYKTNGYVDITSGELLRKLKNGEDFQFKSMIEKLDTEDGVLKEKFNFNFDNVIGSYATNEVLNYFKQNDIKKYIVSENGDISAGEYYDSGNFKVSINKPNSNGILEVVYLENKSMASRYNTNKFEAYMVNPKTSKKESKYDGVIVISSDNLTANMLVNSLFLMDIDEGKKMVLDYSSEAMWIDGNEIVKTDGFDKYLKNN